MGFLDKIWRSNTTNVFSKSQPPGCATIGYSDKIGAEVHHWHLGSVCIIWHRLDKQCRRLAVHGQTTTHRHTQTHTHTQMAFSLVETITLGIVALKYCNCMTLGLYTRLTWNLLWIELIYKYL